MGVKKERLHTSARARELGNSLWPVRTPALLDALEKYGTLTDFDNSHIYPTVQAAVAAFRAGSAES
jgi:hypothetical protein